MKEYIKPQLEVIEYSLDDVISASPMPGSNIPEAEIPEIVAPTDDPFFGWE